ncbi:MAG: EamA family transporter [Ornithinimicrobium sp.]|uniref:EamA family transporter n=1 Tax=Ornithinimicrobium sp. TaxID=1977084 RepID=UPI003D9BCBD8
MLRSTRTGLTLALISAATFGTSGALGKPLLDAGWSPAAAVAARVSIGALLLLLPAVYALRGQWHTLRTGWRSIVLFGLLAVAVAQGAFFQAVQYIPVGVAMLLEYLGIILVVGWLWLRHGERLRPLTLLGAALAAAGLVFVLNVFGALQLDLVGVLWGLLAATGLAGYFVISADETTGVPPLAIGTGGLAVGAVMLASAGTLGLIPWEWSTTDVALAGVAVPYWVDVLALGLFAAALAYGAGVAATRRLGSKLGSFIGLTEVLFSILFAWLLLGQLPAPIQALGGLLILAGVVAVKLDERPRLPAAHPEPLHDATV